MNNPLKKRVKKPKEQIVAEIKQKQQWEREKDIARTLVFPVLEKHTRSVHHAEQVCGIIRAVVTTQQNNYWMDKTIGDLHLIEELKKDADSADPEMYEELLTNLKDVPIMEALRVSDILGQIIGAHAQNMTYKLKLSEVPIEEIIK